MIVPRAKNTGDATWLYDLRAPVTDYGVPPAALPPGMFAVMSGVDGRADGAIVRFPGFRHLTSIPLVSGGGWDYGTAHHFMPFDMPIVSEGAYGRLQGFVYFWDDPNPTLRACHIRYYSTRSGTWGSLTLDATSGNLTCKELTTEGAHVTVPLPGASDPVCSAVYGQNIYLVWRTGGTWYKVTIRWPPLAVGPIASLFGPYDPAETDRAWDPAPSWGTPGRSVVGSTAFKLQFVDPARGRVSQFTEPYFLETSSTNIKKHLTTSYYGTGTNAIGVADAVRSAYTHYDVYVTVSSGDPDVAAGGYYHFMDRMPIYDHPTISRDLLAWLRFWAQARTETPTGTSAFCAMAVTDAQTAVYPYIDAAYDAVDALPGATALAEFRNVTFAVIPSDLTTSGAVEIAWTPPHVLRKEVFPQINRFPTLLNDPTTARFVVASSALYLFGDSEYYRITVSVDGIVSVRKLGDSIACAGAHAAGAVDDTIYVLCDRGVLEVDAPTGSVSRVRALDRLVSDRWRGTLTSVYVAYDSGLDAVLILNAHYAEMVVLWRSTGRISMMSDMPFQAMYSLRLGGATRAVGVGRQPPNPPLLVKTTYISLKCPSLYLGESGPPTTVGITHSSFRPQVKVIGAQNLPSSGEIRLLVDWDASAMSAALLGALDGGFVRVLTGALAGMRWPIKGVKDTGFGTAYIYLGYYQEVPGSTPFGPFSVSAFTGAWLALGPMPLEVVGAPLELPEGYIGASRRRRTKQVGVFLWEDPTYADQTDYTQYPVFWAGTIGYDSLRVPADPYWDSSMNERPVGFWATPATNSVTGLTLEAPLADTDPYTLRVEAVTSGYFVFPYVRCLAAGSALELHELAVDGSLPAAGPNTTAFGV